MPPSYKLTQFLPEGIAIRDTQTNKFRQCSIAACKLQKLQTFPEIQPWARLIRHVLYSILSACVNFDSLKSSMFITLVISLQPYRQDFDINCQK